MSGLILYCIIPAQPRNLQTKPIFYHPLGFPHSLFSSIFLRIEIKGGNLRIFSTKETGQETDPKTTDSLILLGPSMIPQIPFQFLRIIIRISHLQEIPLQHSQRHTRSLIINPKPDIPFLPFPQINSGLLRNKIRIHLPAEQGGINRIL